MNIVQSFMTNNPCYKAGRKINVKGLMLHSVGCPQPSANVFINQMNKSSYSRACVHAFIDANTGVVYQTLPWDHRGWHGGGSSNDTHIGVEMCEPAEIKYTGGSTFTCSNKTAAKAAATRTYNSAVELFAVRCKEFNLNPLTDICSHKEGHKKGIASNHGDPEHLWKGLGLPYTMDGFRQDVKAAMSGTPTPGKAETPASSGKLYRVQVGAFAQKANAEDLLVKVKSAGFDAIIIQADGLYKVQIGAYSVKKNADNVLAAAKNAGFNAFITDKGGQTVASGAAISVYYPKYTGTSGSVDVVLKAVGVPDKFRGNWAKRKPIAEANGISNYSGTATQNTKLVTLAKQGKLKRV